MPPTAEPKTHDFTANILKGIGKVITPDNKLEVAPPEPPVPPKPPEPPKPPSVGNKTLGEIAVEVAKKEAEAKANPPVVPPPAPPVPVAPPAAAAAPEPPAPKLKKREVVATPPVAVQPPPAPPITPAPAVQPPPAPTKDPDEAFIATLTPEQKDELQMAEFAETKFPELKGKRAEVLGFFKKVDQFATTNPQTQPGSEEFQTFIESNKPKWTAGQKRKVEHAFITDAAVKTAREEVMREVTPQLEAQRKKIHDQEVAPLIEKAVSEFEAVMTAQDTMPAEVETMPASIMESIRSKGVAVAMEEDPVGVPIAFRAQNAAREYLNLVRGRTRFDPNNVTHTGLVDFIAKQGDFIKDKPEAVRDGRPFMPYSQYMELVTKNPIEAGKYWTFDDADVLNLIAVNANYQYDGEIKRLEKAGFKREKKNKNEKPPSGQTAAPPVPAPPTPPAPAPQPPTPPSPRVRGSAAPGAGETEVKAGPARGLLNTLIPGAAERLGI